MTPHAEPRTEAGKRLLEWMESVRSPVNLSDAILAIEAEAEHWAQTAATPADSLDVLRAVYDFWQGRPDLAPGFALYNRVRDAIRAEGSSKPPHVHEWRDHGSRGEGAVPDVRCDAQGHESGSSKPPEPRHSGIALWDPVRGARPYSDDDPALSGSSKPEAEKP